MNYLSPMWRWLVAAGFGLAVMLTPLPYKYSVPAERTFRIEASSYQYSPAILKVNPGDKVTLELVSTDVVHGLHIDGYDLEVTADPGQPQRLTFVANREGSFRMRCSVACGALHPFMLGKLKVGQNMLLWRAGGLSVLAVLAGLLFFHRGAGR